MAVNPYSTPAQAQFINTYTPIPFQEMVQAGQARQQAYDVNKQAFEQQLNAARQLKAMPGADTRYIEGTVIPTFEELANKYSTKDYGSQETINEINRVIGQNVDRRLVGNIQASYTGYQNYLKQKQEMEAKGTPILRSSLQDPSKHATSITGIFSSTPEAELDWRKATDEFFNNIGDKYMGTINLPGGRKGLVHGTKLNALMAYAKDNADVWAQTPEGAQKIRDLKAQGFKGNDTQIASAFLEAQAAEYERNKVSQIYDPLSTSGREKTSTPTANSYITGRAVAMKGLTNNYKNLDDYSKYNVNWFDKQGKQVSNFERAMRNIRFGWGEEDLKVLEDKLKTIPEFKDKASAVNYTALIAKTADYMGVRPEELVNKNDKELRKDVNAYLKDYQERGYYPDVREITDPDKSKWINTILLGKDPKTGTLLAEGRRWYDPAQGAFPDYNYDNPNTSSGYQKYSDITRDYPVGQYNYHVTGELTPYNPFMPSGYTVDIIDKKSGDVARQVYMGGPERNEGTGAIETSERANALKHTLYKQMFANPTGLVSIKETYKGKPVSIDGMVLNAGQVKLQVSDNKGNAIGTLDVNQQSTEEQTMRLVEKEIHDILSKNL